MIPLYVEGSDDIDRHVQRVFLVADLISAVLLSGFLNDKNSHGCLFLRRNSSSLGDSLAKKTTTLTASASTLTVYTDSPAGNDVHVFSSAPNARVTMNRHPRWERKQMKSHLAQWYSAGGHARSTKDKCVVRRTFRSAYAPTAGDRSGLSKAATTIPFSAL